MMQLKELTDEISAAININTKDIKKIVEILKQYKWDDYKGYISFDNEKYSRNFIIRNELFDIVLLCWWPNQWTNIHGHPDKWCCVKVLEWSLEETIYNKDDKKEFIYQRKTWQILYNHDTLWHHRIKNITKQPAISLHVYAPWNYKPTRI